MAIFKSQVEAEHFLVGMWTVLANDPDIKPKLTRTKMVARACYTDPEFEVTIDMRDGEVVAASGPSGIDADITLYMEADLGHQFWLGSVNLPLAMAKRQVRTEGDMGEVLKLLPVLKPAFARYREFVESEGRADLLTK